MDIVLVAGLWLDRSAWDGVVPELAALGHRAVPVTLPAGRAATLDDQVAAVVAAVDSAAGKPLVVGHSAACTLAWLAADARPDRVAKVALIGGFPARPAPRRRGRIDAAALLLGRRVEPDPAATELPFEHHDLVA